MMFQNHVLARLGAKTVLCMTLHREQREIEGVSFSRYSIGIASLYTAFDIENTRRVRIVFWRSSPAWIAIEAESLLVAQMAATYV